MQTGKLRRALGLRDLVAFYVAAVIGPRWIATAAAAGPSSLVVWLLAAGTLFVPLGFTVIELSSRYPNEGGIYVWTKRAFGDSAGFVAGWMCWVSNLVYYPGLLYFAAGNALFVGGTAGGTLNASPTYYIAVSMGGLALACGLHVVGLNIGKRLHDVGAIGTWLPLAMLVVMGVVAYVRFGSATPIDAHTLTPSFAPKDLIFWSVLAFGFAGFEAASFMGEEIEDARRTIPRAIVIAGIAIAAIYILGTLAVLLAIPPKEATGLQGIMQAIARTADRVGFGALTPVAAILIALGSIGGVAAWMASNARLPFVAGLDRYLPPAFGKLHPRWGTPYVALLTQTAIAALFAFLGQAGTTVQGAYDGLVSMGVIAYFIPYMLMFAALIRLQREPAGPGVRRVPGKAVGAWVLGLLGIVVTGASIVLSVLPPADSPNPRLAVVKVVGASLALLAIGMVIYRRGARRIAR